MRKILCLSVLIFVGFAASAMDVSPYIAGIVGSTSYTAKSGGTSTTQSAGVGFGFFGGFGLSRHFALDGAYTSYGKADNSDAYLSSLAVYLKGVIPLNYQFRIFGKLGFANVTSHSGGSSNQTGSGIAYAAGVSFKVTPNVYILGQYQADDANAGDSKLEPSMWSLGVKYDFK